MLNKVVVRFLDGKVLKDTIGTCVHKLLAHPGKPGRLYQQNHVGVYRSDNYGDSWDRIDKGLPFEFGFGLALNPGNPDTCYVTPLEPEGGMYRATPGKFCVYRLRSNGSTSWEELSNGLPAEAAFISVLREGMSQDTLNPCGIYVGTGTGHLYHTADAGDSWRAIATHLPPILSVSAAVV